MPMQRERYPTNWKEISLAIREREGNRCKWCGVKNGAIGARDRHGVWHDDKDISSMSCSVGEMLFDEHPKIIKITLTVAHIDHDTTNNDEGNLAALCNKCHLNHDKKQHAANAAATRLRKKQALYVPMFTENAQ